MRQAAQTRRRAGEALLNSAAPHRGIRARDRKIALPEPAPRKLQDASGLGAAHEVREGALDGRRVRSLSAQTKRLVQEPRVEHKTRAFHAFIVRAASERAQAAVPAVGLGAGPDGNGNVHVPVLDVLRLTHLALVLKRVDLVTRRSCYRVILRTDICSSRLIGLSE